MYKKITMLFLIIVHLAGCGTAALYKGDTKADHEVAKFWNTKLNIEKPVGYVRVVKIGDHKLTTRGGREYALLPGEYDLEVVFSSSGCAVNVCRIGSDMTYRIRLKMEAGQTYVPTIGDNSHPPHQVCILGEAHDAPGHAVNITKEFRWPSKNAKVVACS
jgi:hypothetical protein